MSFARVRGHDEVAQFFRHSLERGRLGHAYLFVGPPGIGKRMFAVELARALLCERPKTPLDACDHCPACLLVEAGTHPDLQIAGRPEDASELPIEVIRKLNDGLGLKPARGGRKIAILDDADDLNDASANCFLKTLEEPPPESVLILVGSSPERQLTTIRSRCQLVRFRPLSQALMQAILTEHGVEDGNRDRLIRLGHGSPGQALALNDPTLDAFRTRLIQGLLARPFSHVAVTNDWMEFIKESGTQRPRAALVLRLLIEWLQNLLPLVAGGSLVESEPAAQDLADRLGVERLLRVIDRCLEADTQLDRNVQVVLVIEAFLDAYGQLQDSTVQRPLSA